MIWANSLSQRGEIKKKETKRKEWEENSDKISKHIVSKSSKQNGLGFFWNTKMFHFDIFPFGSQNSLFVLQTNINQKKTKLNEKVNKCNKTFGVWTEENIWSWPYRNFFLFFPQFAKKMQIICFGLTWSTFFIILGTWNAIVYLDQLISSLAPFSWGN